MTPTLIGRWQTRILLLGTLGVLVTIPFSLNGDPLYFQVLLAIAVLGCMWDIVYNQLQTLRWDHDWSAILQLASGIWEAFFFYVPFKFLISSILKIGWLNTDIPLDKFLLHYSCIWLAVFTASQTLMRVIFPRWRFYGGEWFKTRKR
ncbi:MULTISPECIES: hypothetical protein [Pseudanabaena]|uniref:hypothetical protein n=1 Tax=Pseudanabaena TaxID=1152 RepID=UPI002478A312|nr:MULTISPECIES: hypothetical protein [Pseudanabaena]MEA5486436.1 hypothetical protein [Pseudanabaena sp. CCNP1317]WGS72701.1 hypothetical protein OA858_01350 [Pseudanabaena galeata CCNP1313]